jgi:hypothetical protein
MTINQITREILIEWLENVLTPRLDCTTSPLYDLEFIQYITLQANVQYNGPLLVILADSVFNP